MKTNVMNSSGCRSQYQLQLQGAKISRLCNDKLLQIIQKTPQ